METPDTLQQAIVWFSDFEHCRQFMMELRWPDGVVKCPTCGSTEVYFTKSRRIWQCKEKHAKVTILTVPFLLLATPRGEPTAELTSAMRSIHDAFNASGPTSCAASRLLP